MILGAKPLISDGLSDEPRRLIVVNMRCAMMTCMNISFTTRITFRRECLNQPIGFPAGSLGQAAAHRPTGRLEQQLLALCQPFRHDPSATQAKLCRRIERHIKSLPRTGYGELFVFVAEPDVPSDNNPAERSLRHLVISRKVSGGTRSERGTERKMTLASRFWRAQGLNPHAACRQLLVSPLL